MNEINARIKICMHTADDNDDFDIVKWKMQWLMDVKNH